MEHLASLRAIPNLNVYRPCDIVETAECWAAALATKSTPSIISLSRQGLPCLRQDQTVQNLSANGGYVLSDTDSQRDITLLATGSEVSLALEAGNLLMQEEINAAVVSMPCMEIFEAQNLEYRKKVLQPGVPVVVVEAAVEQSWGKYLGIDGKFVGMSLLEHLPRGMIFFSILESLWKR
ncbi:MAG: hypothetical protein CM1200mP28_01900 [Deltaproteobacteria bacterium]|nr:MAG: hypothetical protein CM1200mP28_01900 [Deltaproteobacteria bacterium]